MSTRFRIIYLYFNNSHNFVSLILIKKNQYPSFSNCFSIIFPISKESCHQLRVINLFSQFCSSHTQPKQKKRKSIYLFFNPLHFPYIIERIVSSTLPPSSNLIFVREKNYLPKVSTTTPLRERKKKKKRKHVRQEGGQRGGPIE